MTDSATLRDASTLIYWVLGRSNSERLLADLAKRSRWSDERYAAAFEHCIRYELLVWDPRVWEVSRSWARRKGAAERVRGSAPECMPQRSEASREPRASL